MHLAAMPFPSYQGTQAALRSMFDVLARETELHALFYAHGARHEKPRWNLHPLKRKIGTASMRSGPSFEKIALDSRLYCDAKQLIAQIKPEIIYAHHIEALLMARLLAHKDVRYVAHTDLKEELATYFKGVAAKKMLQRMGAFVDRKSLKLATRVAAVSPSLVSYLSSLCNVEVFYIPIPWSVERPLPPSDRQRLRALHNIRPQTCVLLYVGNLDAYQGWTDLLQALALLGHVHKYRLRVVTASHPTPLVRYAKALGIFEAVDIISLDGPTRRNELNMADLVLVPRHAGRGLPIKLLDALAYAKHVVAYRKATGGLGLGDAVHEVDNTPLAMAQKIQALDLSSLGLRDNILGQRFVAEQHSPERFLEAWLRFSAPIEGAINRFDQGRKAA